MQTLSDLGPPFKPPVNSFREFDWEVLRWICLHEAYQTWLQNDLPEILVLHGGRGVGKSLISRCLFHHSLCITDARDLSTCYFSFDKQDCRRNSAKSAITSLIYQILSTNPSLFKNVRDFYTHLKKQCNWTKDNLWKLFRRLVLFASPSPVICTINAIHFCDDPRNEFLRDLVTFHDTTHSGFRIILISERQADIFASLTWYTNISLDEPIQSNVKFFVQDGVSRLIEKRPSLADVAGELTSKLSRSTDFLWISFTLRHLELARFRSTRSSMLAHIGSLPSNSTEFIKRTLSEIPAWGVRALSWILHARRPLKQRELAMGLAVSDEDTSPLALNANIAQDIVGDLKEALGPLLKFEDNEIQLFHPFIKEYLDESLGQVEVQIEKIISNGHWDICKSCMAYLSMDVFKDKDFLTNTQSKTQDRLFDFLDYAIQYWPDHYRNTEADSLRSERVLEFLCTVQIMRTWAELYWRYANPDLRQDMCLDSPIHFAAQLGFSDIVTVLLNKAQPHGITAFDRDLAMELATSHGHANVVKQFLTDEIEAMVVEKALDKASAKGDEEVVKILVGHQATSKRELDLPPSFLCRAAQDGYEELVLRLLDAGASVDSTSGDFQSTPLHLASAEGHEAVVQRLLARGAKPGKLDATGSTPLFLAARNGHSKVVSALIHADTDMARKSNKGPISLGLTTQDGFLGIAQHLPEALEDPRRHLSINRSTPLHQACLNGHLDVVHLLIDNGTSIQQQDENGQSPLMLAASKGYNAIVDFLIERDANVSVASKAGSALYQAMTKGFKAIAEILLLKGADPNPKEEEEEILDSTPLILAVKNGFCDIVKMMLEKGATTSTKDRDGLLAIHHAGATGHVNILLLLLEYGASIQIPDKSSKKRTAIHHAVVNNQEAVLNVLLDRGMDIDFQDGYSRTALILAVEKGYESMVSIILARGANPNIVEDSDRTALHFAADTGHQTIVELLLERSSVVNAKDRAGDTALNLAVRGRLLDVVQLLRNKGADPRIANFVDRNALQYAASMGNVALLTSLYEGESDLGMRDKQNDTLLHLATQRGKKEQVVYLLKKGAYPDCKGFNGETPLLQAASNGHLELVQMFLENGANLYARSYSLTTVLHHACTNQNRDVLRFLLKLNREVNSGEKDGRTPFHVASTYGNIGALDALLETEVDLHARINDGRTALHMVYSDHDAAVWLIEHGLAVDVVDNDGKTPLVLAVEHRESSMVQLFLDYNANPNATDNRGRSPILCIPVKRDMDKKGMEIAEMLINAKADVNHIDKNLNSALSNAIANDSKALTQLLIARGANIEARGACHNTMIMIAILKTSKDVINILIEAGANLKAKNSRGVTALILSLEESNEDAALTLIEHGSDVVVDGVLALQWASHHGYDDVVCALLSKGVDVNGQTNRFDTALEAAIRGNYGSTIEKLLQWGLDLNLKGGKYGCALSTAVLEFPEAVDFLLDKGAKASIEDDQGRVALHHAARLGRRWRRLVYERILEEGSNITVRDKQGRTVIHHAASGAAYSIVKPLLESNPELNVPDGDGWTPLHWACRTLCMSIVKLLLEKGTDPTLPCRKGWTPWHIATFHGKEQFLKILEASKIAATSTGTTRVLEGKKQGKRLFGPRIERGEKQEANCDGCELVSFLTATPLTSLSDHVNHDFWLS